MEVYVPPFFYFYKSLILKFRQHSSTLEHKKTCNDYKVFFMFYFKNLNRISINKVEWIFNFT